MPNSLRFFGNFIDSFLPFLVPLKNSLMLVDPMTNPMQVLGISLLLGVVHLMFGLLIAAYEIRLSAARAMSERSTNRIL